MYIGWKEEKRKIESKVPQNSFVIICIQFVLFFMDMYESFVKWKLCRICICRFLFLQIFKKKAFYFLFVVGNFLANNPVEKENF